MPGRKGQAGMVLAVQRGGKAAARRAQPLTGLGTLQIIRQPKPGARQIGVPGPALHILIS